MDRITIFLTGLMFAIMMNGISTDRARFSCRNLQNEPVDWFIIYKIPAVSSSTTYNNRAGVSFLYMDPSTKGKWKNNSAGIDSREHPVAFTIQQVYDSKSASDVCHVMYNDEIPDSLKSSSIGGHCKGVLLFDRNSGFWLIHSVPKFPPNDSYIYPQSGTRYGQSFLCVNFPYSSLANISSQLFLNDPSIYSWTLPPSMAQEQPILAEVVKGKSKKKPPYSQQINLVSSNGVRFISFAKHKKWNQDLYSDFVAPSLNRSLYTETWQNGGGDLRSNCTGKFSVNNIDIVTLTPENVEFRDTKDHSKWAISSDNGNYVCIGDINRQKGQLKRGGGTMCFQDGDVWKTYKSSVTKVESCQRKTDT